MAEQTKVDNDYPEHERTYDAFVRLTIGSILYITLICITLLGMTYIGGLAFWVGLIGLILGTILIIITMIAGLTWTPMLLLMAAVIVMTIVGL